MVSKRDSLRQDYCSQLGFDWLRFCFFFLLWWSLFSFAWLIVSQRDWMSRRKAGGTACMYYTPDRLRGPRVPCRLLCLVYTTYLHSRRLVRKLVHQFRPTSTSTAQLLSWVVSTTSCCWWVVVRETQRLIFIPCSMAVELCTSTRIGATISARFQMALSVRCNKPPLLSICVIFYSCDSIYTTKNKIDYCYEALLRKNRMDISD